MPVSVRSDVRHAVVPIKAKFFPSPAFGRGCFFYIVGAFFEEICIRYRVFRGLFEFDVSNFAIVPGNMFVR